MLGKIKTRQTSDHSRQQPPQKLHFNDGFVITTLLLAFPEVVAATGAEEEDGELASNLFSDLAPLLSLFGERFVLQFLATNASLFECVIFALAPLGVLATCVAAIRVGGPVWMRSVIGRAQEPAAIAELELMTSTSHEVCELWDGGSASIKCVLRTPETPEIRQFLYFDDSIKKEIAMKGNSGIGYSPPSLDLGNTQLGRFSTTSQGISMRQTGWVNVHSEVDFGLY